MSVNPFASPEYSEPAPAYASRAETRIVPFVPGTLRARVAATALGVAAVLAAVGAVLFGLQTQLVGRLLAGAQVLPDEAAANNDRVNGITELRTAAAVIAIICYLCWQYRARTNLPALGARHLEFTRGWGMSYWFIPFVHLFRPYQVTKEIWLASNPDLAGDLRWREGRVSPLLGFWWGCWILFNAFAIIANVMLGESVHSRTTLDSLYQGSTCLAASSLFSCLAACQALAIVLKINRRQLRAYEALQSRPAEEAEPGVV